MLWPLLGQKAHGAEPRGLVAKMSVRGPQANLKRAPAGLRSWHFAIQLRLESVLTSTAWLRHKARTGRGGSRTEQTIGGDGLMRAARYVRASS